MNLPHPTSYTPPASTLESLRIRPGALDALDPNVRLLSVEMIRGFCGCENEKVWRWMQGAYVFDLSKSASAERRLWRIWRGCLAQDFTAHKAEHVIGDALLTSGRDLEREYFLGSTQLEVAWSTTDDHLRHLKWELGGVLLKGRWRFHRARCARFLQERMIR